MNLASAQHYAAKLAEWVAPYCERVAIAGSVRRGRPVVNDIDLVVIPKLTPREDLLGTPEEPIDHLNKFIAEYMATGCARWRTRSAIDAGALPAEFGRSIYMLDLPKCALDIFTAGRSTWATKLLCRTGSKEHNIFLCTRAKQLGMMWSPTNGVFDADGRVVPAQNEGDIYEALKMPFVRVENRELEYLRRLKL